MTMTSRANGSHLEDYHGNCGYFLDYGVSFLKSDVLDWFEESLNNQLFFTEARKLDAFATLLSSTVVRIPCCFQEITEHIPRILISTCLEE